MPDTRPIPLEDLPAALFTRTAGGMVLPSSLTRSPWSSECLHGGAVTGLAGWAAQTGLARPELTCSRLTVDIFSLVPVAPLAVTTDVVRSGGRTATVDVDVRHEGRLVARATSTWLAQDPLELGDPRLALAEREGRPWATEDFEYPRPGFNADAVAQRIESGSTEEPGPGRIWCSLRRPVMAGEQLTPFQHVAALSDLAAAVGWERSPTDGSMINPDVTLGLLREPIGEWVLIDSGLVFSGGGTSVARAELSDRHGVIGWVLLSQIEAPAHLEVG